MNFESFGFKESKELSQISRRSPKKRAIKIFHNKEYNGPQICLNMIQPDSYIRPHFRYHDEALIYFKGKLFNIQFDNQGIVMKKNILWKKENTYLWVPAKTFHHRYPADGQSPLNRSGVLRPATLAQSLEILAGHENLVVKLKPNQTQRL